MGEVIAFRPRVVDPAGASSGDRSPHAPARRDPAAANRSDSRLAAHREPLWREVTGQVLRDERHRQGRTLAQVAGRAGMSVQYLSEMERGRKDSSSEMLAAACGSLGLSLADFARRSAQVISSPASAPTGPLLLAA